MDVIKSCTSKRMIERVSQATSSIAKGAAPKRSLSKLWSGYQEDLQHLVQQAHGPGRAETFRILVVSPVRDSRSQVENFEFNMRRLQGSGHGDTFHYALFHYYGTNNHFAGRSWYKSQAGPVVYRDIRAWSCKAQSWMQIPPSLSEHYDYVWLLDADLRFDYFSWGLYRTFLAVHRPLVSQPSVIGKSAGELSTRLTQLQMMPRDEWGKFPIAYEVEKSESMAVLLSTRIWPAFTQRMQGNDLHSNWYLTRFADILTLVSKLHCNTTSILFINASPVRHMNCHDLFATPGDCVIGCGQGQANCRSVEPEAMVRHLKGICKLPDASDAVLKARCSRKPVRVCHANVSPLVPKTQWVEEDGALGLGAKR